MTNDRFTIIFMKKTIAFLLLLLLISACGPSEQLKTEQTAQAFTAAATQWTDTPTISPSPTLTDTPSPNT